MSERRSFRFNRSTCLLAASLCAVAAIGTSSPGLAATPGPFLEYSNLTGTGGTITITRLPIQKSDGTFVYKDVTIGLSSGATGTLSISGTLTQAISPTLLVANIKAGLYAYSASTATHMTVSGPGVIGGGGVAKWSLSPTTGLPCATPATFYTGPISANPLYQRLHKANITSAEYNYGIVDVGNRCGAEWSTGNIIGVAQLGNQIEVAAFTNPSTGQDQSTPYSRILYNFLQ